MGKSKVTGFDGFPDQISKISGAKIVGIEFWKIAIIKLDSVKHFRRIGRWPFCAMYKELYVKLGRPRQL